MQPHLAAALVPVDEDFGLDPNALYGKHSPEAKRCIGLSPMQTDAAIRRGDIIPPFDVTRNGRLRAWFGYQLIAILRQRLEQQRNEAAELAAMRPVEAAKRETIAAEKRAKRVAAKAAAEAAKKSKPETRNNRRTSK